MCVCKCVCVRYVCMCVYTINDKSYAREKFHDSVNVGKTFVDFALSVLKVLKRAIAQNIYFCDLLRICKNRKNLEQCKICLLQYMYVSMYMHACMCICVHKYVDMYVYVCIHAFMCVVCMFVCHNICMHVCT